MPPKLPIGIDLFQHLRAEGYYYVDKSPLIKDLLESPAAVTLFTRPRRFGKTLNMSMLQAFFERGTPNQKALFQGLKIMDAGDACLSMMGKHPVVFLSLKGVEGLTPAVALEKMALLIMLEALRHDELRSSDRLDATERALLAQILDPQPSQAFLEMSLQVLCQLLEKHYGEKVVVLIDEYDVPLDKAYVNGYYGEMVAFMRGFLGAALKTNPHLQFAVLTGCLRISRESIFTGLNNLKVLSIRDSGFSSYFGFTAAEVERLFADFGFLHRLPDARAWYDGYRFCDDELYNPWDILNFCDLLAQRPDAAPKSYWINTSANDIIRLFIERADGSTRREIERLVDGETVVKPIREEITYGEIDDDSENLWSFLFLTGYLTTAARDDGTDRLQLRIPNREVRGIYIEKIQKWFDTRMRAADLSDLYRALFGGDAKAVEARIAPLLLTTISYHDAQESYYHGFLTGIFKAGSVGSVVSNREAGHGRSDILFEAADGVHAAVIEVKRAADVGALDAACDAALRQIDEKEYAQPLREWGYTQIWKYGVAFCGKRCRVKSAPAGEAG